MEIKNPHCIVKRDNEKKIYTQKGRVNARKWNNLYSVFREKRVTQECSNQLNGHLWVKAKTTTTTKNKNKTQNFKKKTYTNTKQNKKHIEIEKLPKYITNKILFEGKRA